MSRLMDVSVIAPRPWFPGLVQPDDDVEATTGDAETVSRSRHPRMFYLPRVAKLSDPWFFARTLVSELRQRSADRQPDLIDAHFEWPDGVGAMLAARRLGLPFAITLRGKIVSQSRHTIRRMLMRQMLRAAAVRIAVSGDLARRAEQLAADGRPVRVIPNGVDREVFQLVDRAAARHELGWSDTARYLISVGWLQELKGFHRVVDALPAIRAAAGDVRLVLVGGPAGEPAYERRMIAQIAERGMQAYVTRVTHAAPQAVATMLNAADLFVLATRSEGWCNAIHESLACGTPVVATDVGGNRELVRSADDGLLVPLNSAHDLAAATIASLRRPWNRDRIGLGLATRGWEVVAAEVRACFEQSLEPACTPCSSAI